MIVLETERSVLRQLSTADAEFMLDLLNQPSFIRNIGDRGVRTVEEAEQYILKGPVDSYERYGFGLYLVELKESGVPIGISGLIKRDALPDVDIGFAFLPQFWSKGYATESASAVLSYGRDLLGLKRIVAIAAQDNEGSINVLEKIGLRFEGLIIWPDDEEEIALYSVDF